MSRCHNVATTLCPCCTNIHNTSAGVVDQGLNPTINLRPDSKGPIKGILLQVGGLRIENVDKDRDPIKQWCYLEVIVWSNHNVVATL